MKIYRPLFYLIVFIFFSAIYNSLCAKISVSKVFSSNMVLQRNIATPIWGKGVAREIITVEIEGIKTLVKVDENGKWIVRLPKFKAGGPYILKIFNQQDTITLSNVLVGDVWLASGQSNMQMALSWGVNNKEEEIKNANYPNIRFLSVTNDLDNKPLADIAGGEWMACTPESVKDFSAIGYFFARQISNEMNIPIGIINSTWGGTDIQAWMSRKALETLPFYQDTLPKIISQTGDFSYGYEQFMQTNKLRDSIIEHSTNGIEQKVFSPNYDDTTWKTMKIPCKWKDYGINNFFGYVWFRKNIQLKEIEKDLVLNLGEVHLDNIAYFNGIELKKQGTGANVSYVIPASLLKKGDNLIALRVLGRWAVGGLYSPSELINVTSTDKSTDISLANTWKYNEKIEPETPSWLEFYNYPTFIFNAKISPIIPFGLKGIIWYQGENNTKNPEGYTNYFSLMVNDWRTRWGQGDLPVVFGQLSNCNIRTEKPTESRIAELREHQAKGTQLINTAMVANIDLGLVDGDVHFKNKQASGKRFADAALGLVYGKKLAYTGSSFQSLSIHKNKITIKFSATSGKLKCLGNKPLTGFAIAGEDKKFFCAEAIIAGNKVIVWNDTIKNPKFVRYGWADNPDCNLYNGVDLPVLPFRTDK